MKDQKKVLRIMGIASLVCLAFNFIAYQILQTRLTPGLERLPEDLYALGNLLIPSLIIIGISHLIFLMSALKNVSGKWPDSVLIVFIVLSGITLLSDAALLSDIGKEFLSWDVSQEWLILYMLTAFHILVVLAGLFFSRRYPAQNSKLFSLPAGAGDSFYLSVHQIGLLCGLLGFGGVSSSSAGLLVPERFALAFMFLLAALVLLPLALYLLFWLLRLKRKQLCEWLDEKQLRDTSTGALFSLIASLIFMALFVVADLSFLPGLSVVFWLLLLFFIQLSTYSAAVLARNR